MIPHFKILTPEGKQQAIDHFLTGATLSDVANKMGVSRRHIEQCARECIVQLVKLTKPEPAADDSLTITESPNA